MEYIPILNVLEVYNFRKGSVLDNVCIVKFWLPQINKKAEQFDPALILS